jgi:hypothetical protein
MPAPQTDSGSKFDASVTASITSDYNYRGYTLSDHKPSVSTNFEATYNIIFASVNADSVQIPMLSQLQKQVCVRYSDRSLSRVALPITAIREA